MATWQSAVRETDVPGGSGAPDVEVGTAVIEQELGLAIMPDEVSPIADVHAIPVETQTNMESRA